MGERTHWTLAFIEAMRNLYSCVCRGVFNAHYSGTDLFLPLRLFPSPPFLSPRSPLSPPPSHPYPSLFAFLFLAGQGPPSFARLRKAQTRPKGKSRRFLSTQSRRLPAVFFSPPTAHRHRHQILLLLLPLLLLLLLIMILILFPPPPLETAAAAAAAAPPPPPSPLHAAAAPPPPLDAAAAAAPIFAAAAPPASIFSDLFHAPCFWKPPRALCGVGGSISFFLGEKCEAARVICFHFVFF